MGMRGSVRISRGIWVSGGGGFVTFLLAIRLVELGVIAFLVLVAAVVTIVVGVAFMIWQSSGTARRELARQSLVSRVDSTAVRIVGERSDPPVWGVYLMGHEIYTGPHPKRKNALARLYPHRSDLVCAALMPDAMHANAAARQLRQHGFSASELVRLFSAAPTVPSTGIGTAHAEPAELAGQQVTEATPHDGSHSHNKELTKMKNERDLTKYRFEGEVLGKGRLVWAVVRRYVADHPGVSFEELRQAFPDELQASSALQFSPLRVVVARLSDIPQSEVKRFHLSEGETLTTRNSDVAVSREWNLDNIQAFLARAKELGYEIAIAS